MANNTHNYNIEKMLASDLITDRAKEALLVLTEKGTMVETAIALGIRKRTLQDLLSRANKSMMAEELESVVPNSHVLQGTSTLYKVNEETGQKEEVLQWVKTKTDKDNELEMVHQVTSELARSVEGLAVPVEVPELVQDDLLVTYVSTDLHLGQYSWAEETGSDVNAETVYRNTVMAMRLLRDTTPNAKECIVLDLGDTLHSSDDANRTKSGHVLDVDTRHAKVFKALVDMKIEMIDLALEKHEIVKYVIVAGNHSDLVPNYLMAMLSAYYRNEPRFQVDENVAIHKYHRHGETLLGFTHGHTSKMARLSEVMVWDRKDDISSTSYRYWLTGHVHSDRVLDGGICRCESFRNNTKNDAWAAGMGFRGNKQTTAVTYSRQWGEVNRTIIPIAMLEKQ